MKKFCLTILLSLNATNVMAAIGPGPIEDLSSDARMVSHVFLDRQVRECVKELQEGLDRFAITKATVQDLVPGQRKFEFSGLGIQGDIAVGRVKLTVIETESNPEAGGVIYTCTVSLPSK